MTQVPQEVAVDAGMGLFFDFFGNHHEWVWDIDLDRLDQSSSEDCVVGQTFGCYEEGVSELMGESDPSVLDQCNHGFDSMQEDHHNYEGLTNEWRTRIENIRAVTQNPSGGNWPGPPTVQYGESIMTFTVRFTGTKRITLTNQKIGQLFIEAHKQGTTVEELLEDIIGAQASEADYELNV